MKINEKNGASRDIGRYRQILRIMKLTILIITVFLMQVSASSNAQITLSARKESLRKVLKSISKQSGYDLVYTDQDLSKALPVNLNLENASIENALSACFEGQPLVYKILDKTVMVKKKEMPSFLDRIIDRFAAIDARGRILDESGKPLEGATVVLRGTERTTKTDVNGEFVLANVPDDGVLVIRYVGYKQLEIALKDAVMPLEIKLNVATGELEEVNVTYSTGYQNIPKERATGSFVQIDNELYNRSVGGKVLDRIMDVTSGLTFRRTGSATTNPADGVLIRGISTINASKVPLVIVDNFPYDGDLNTINPNDILSVTVLRDAAAASIWGVRAGNGVIVLTTKSGKLNQKAQIEFRANVSIGDKPDIFKVPVISSSEMIEFEKKRFTSGAYNIFDDLLARLNSFTPLPHVAEILLKARRAGISNPTQDPQVIAQLKLLEGNDVRNDVDRYLIQKSVAQQYFLNISGGSDNYAYYASAGYDKNKANSVGNESDKKNFRIDNTFKPTKHIELKGYIAYSESSDINNGLIYNSFIPNGTQISPYNRLINDQGESQAIYGSNTTPLRSAYIDTARYPALLDWHYRPLDELKNKNNRTKQSDARLGSTLNVKVLSGLHVQLQYQYQKTKSKNNSLFNEDTFFTRNLINRYMDIDAARKIIYPVPMGAILDIANIENTSWNVRSQINYNTRIEKHELNLIGGYEIKETTSATEVSRKYGFDASINVMQPVNYLVNYKYRPGNALTPILRYEGLSGTVSRYNSFYGNAGYTFDGKYSLTGSARIDRSNFYGVKANQRRVPLWSAGILWDVSRESFYSNWLPTARIRASYGYNGNTNNSAAAYSTIRYNSLDPISGLLYAILQNPPNPELRWEKTRIVNVGLDLETRNKRISATVEMYRKVGVDLISSIVVDPTVGVSTYTGNNASLKSRGVDLSIRTINIRSSNTFTWNTNLLISYNAEKVSRYEIIPTTISQYITVNTPILEKPLNKIYAYKWAGLDPILGTPRVFLGNMITSFSEAQSKAIPSDLVYMGRSTPAYFGSLTNTFSYKNFSLSFNATYKFGYYFRRPSLEYSSLFNGWGGHADYRLRWQNPGDELHTNVPSAPITDDGRDQIYKNSDILVEKGDHIRLKDLKLTYNLNMRDHKSMGFRSLQLYLYASDLGLLWKASSANLDPEYGDYIVTPKALSLGLNVNF